MQHANHAKTVILSSHAHNYMQLVYKHLEEQAAANDTGGPDLAAEEEALLHGGDQDYPHQLTHAVDNLHESSVISICCWPGDNSRVFTGSGKCIAFSWRVNAGNNCWCILPSSLH